MVFIKTHLLLLHLVQCNQIRTSCFRDNKTKCCFSNFVEILSKNFSSSSEIPVVDCWRNSIREFPDVSQAAGLGAFSRAHLFQRHTSFTFCSTLMVFSFCSTISFSIVPWILKSFYKKNQTLCLFVLAFMAVYNPMDHF